MSIRHVSYSRPDNALAYATLAVFCVFALPEGSTMLGAMGRWASLGLITAFGTVSWGVPVWLAVAAWRAFSGAPRDPQRTLGWMFHGVIACITCELCHARGGWVGERLGALLWETFGFGAYVIVFGIWLVLMFRLLGTERVQVMAEHATSISRQALTYRPGMRLALPANSDVIDTIGETVTLPPPIPAPPIPVPPPPSGSNSTSTVASPIPKPVQRKPSKWDLPDVEALLQEPTQGHADKEYLKQVARDLAERLRHFRLAATVQPAERQGAMVSRYEITPAASQALEAITRRIQDFDAAYKGLRFVPLSGTGKLGVEIPLANSLRRSIALREVLDSAAWTESDAALPLALGVTSSGDPVVIDLASAATPHMLVAGATGSGKSVGVNVMLTSLLLRNSPSDLQLILIDPKKVEFARFRTLPHLLVPVITEAPEAIARLQWACEEMDRRYEQLAEADAENIEVFNETASPRDRMPYLVIVVDEYSDLTCVAVPNPDNPAEKLSINKSKELVEGSVIRLAQKARAAGIHVILATQRPSVDVITGRIKANFAVRIAYKTAQREDSKTIIGAPGAEKLLGNGDSLCLIPSLSTDLVRVHGAFVDKPEVRAVCAAWTSQTTGEERRPPALSKASPDEPVDPAEATKPKQAEAEAGPAITAPRLLPASSGQNTRYTQAVELARKHGYVSARLLAEELGCGHSVAKRLFARLRDENLIKPGGRNNTFVFCGNNAEEN